MTTSRQVRNDPKRNKTEIQGRLNLSWAWHSSGPTWQNNKKRSTFQASTFYILAIRSPLTFNHRTHITIHVFNWSSNLDRRLTNNKYYVYKLDKNFILPLFCFVKIKTQYELAINESINICIFWWMAKQLSSNVALISLLEGLKKRKH